MASCTPLAAARPNRCAALRIRIFSLDVLFIEGGRQILWPQPISMTLVADTALFCRAMVCKSRARKRSACFFCRLAGQWRV